MSKLFVFIFSHNGPQPQLWHDKLLNGNGKEQITPLFKYELTEEEAKAFDYGFLKLKDLYERFKSNIAVANSG